MKRALSIFATCMAFSVYTSAQTYTSDFSQAENPISENGKWTNGAQNGVDWTDVRTIAGIACGTQTGRDTGHYAYNDSYAILSGFPPDQTAEGVVHITNPTGSCNQEVELLLHWNSSAHSATGYECLFRCLNSSGFYMQIVRWNGGLGNFTYIANLHDPVSGIKDGDLLKASIKGNVINVYINGVMKLQCTDNTYTTGNPGIGFFLRNCPESNTDFGFTSFKATGK